MSAPQHIAMKRAEWLSSLCADRAVKLVPLRVAVIIANHINGRLGEAWPSQATIARRLGMAKYNVTKAVRELSTLGYLSVTKSKQSNRYRLRFPDVPPDTSRDVQSDTVTAFHQDTSGVSGGTPDRCLVAHPICEETRLNSDSAAPKGASASFIEVHAPTVAGAPGGARPDRLESEAEIIFGRPLRHDQLIQFRKLMLSLGRGDLGQRLFNYRDGIEAGTIAPIPIAKWLRQGGLVEVVNVA